jgi:hypothetical protein
MVSNTNPRTFCGPPGKGIYGLLEALALANPGAWRPSPDGAKWQRAGIAWTAKNVFAFGRMREGLCDVADVDPSHLSMLVDLYARMYTGILSG